MQRSIVCSLFLALLAPALACLAADVPQMIHYQGYVTVNGQPFSGNARFKFALVDGAGTNTYWSHDGTSVGGAAPTSTLSNIVVSQGLYSILLGDRSVRGMTDSILPRVFTDHVSVFLRVWFDDGVNGLQQLAPDARITSVGYAMVAATVSPGAINSAALAPNLTLGGDATAGTLTLKAGESQTRAVFDAGPSGGNSSLKLFDATGLFDTLRLVGDEDGNGGGQVLIKNGSGHTTLELDGQDGTDVTAGAAMRFKRDSGETVLTIKADIDYGNSGLLLFDVAGGQETVRLTGAHLGTQGAFFNLKNTAGHPTIQLDAQLQDALGAAGGSIELADDEGNTTISLLAKPVSSNPLFQYGGRLELGKVGGGVTVELTGGAADNAGRLVLRGSDLEERVTADADGIGGAGSITLGNTASGNTTVELVGNGGEDQGKLTLLHSNGGTRVVVDADGPNDGAQVKLFDTDGTQTIELRAAQGASAGASLTLSKADGTATIILDAEAGGEGRITTQVLEITGGSDLSERFNISSEGTAVEPGMIVCIDPAHPGKLRISDQPHDMTVAGVISGAGGVKPGMLMGQTGSLAAGKHPVALTGRVYCHVDAAYGAVRPGDLITTSSTPGHGMKARASAGAGAILGKAMTPLAVGRGLVLVLVSLQ